MDKFQESLKYKMDEYAHLIYGITKKFPKEELYGTVSQLRRASLSVVLNYIEGYARRKPLVRLNFLETSYGSLRESKYLVYFSEEEKFITRIDFDFAYKLADEIGAMLWSEISKLDNNLNK